MRVAGKASESKLRTDGYKKAVGLLYACATEDGFLASPTQSANYRRIWARDGAVMTLAALLTRDHDLIATARRTFETLARCQGPHGEIPSNVDTRSGRVSYGGTTGRVDADLWFILGCGEYWRATGDDAFLDGLLPCAEKTRFLLGAWEFNNRGLLYVPQAGDWADEFIHNGYVLYDQLLYLQAQRTICDIHRHVHGSVDHLLLERVSRLRHLIRANYWFDHETSPDDAYHEILHQRGREAAPCRAGEYWMPFFAPNGYGYRFDAFANVLASLLDVADDEQRTAVDRFIDEKIRPAEPRLLPAFHPVIKPVDEDWRDLNMTFSYSFKNHPYEYQNGGLWPMITGFYAADLAGRGDRERAAAYVEGIHQANALEMEGEHWSFPEFVHGKRLTAGGTRQQGWSAAGAIIGEHALRGEAVFRLGGGND